MTDNVKEAVKSLKSHIKFFESLLGHIRFGEPQFKARAMWASWCLHRYINDRLVDDIKEAMEKHGDKKDGM